MWIPIPVFWTKFTATRKGSLPKVVPCENCSTEYVYVLKREATGVGTSLYNVNQQGAADHAESAAEDTLKTILEKDFDPVPCPVCGHYQRYMFPKVLGNQGTWLQFLIIAVLLVGCLTAVFALYWSVAYLIRQTDYRLGNMLVSWAVLASLVLIGFGLSFLKKVNHRRFNPNLTDQQARIALGQARAVTRAAYENAEEEKWRLARRHILSEEKSSEEYGGADPV